MVEPMAIARDPWWIIGSAAVKLLGCDPGDVRDIDVLVSPTDFDALFSELPLRAEPDTAKSMFTSERFGLWDEPVLAVEFMSGLKVRMDDKWCEVAPQTRRRIEFGNCELFVPEAHELVAILISFGRDKDLRRAAKLMRD